VKQWLLTFEKLKEIVTEPAVKRSNVTKFEENLIFWTQINIEEKSMQMGNF
jgi:hypothetical protein